MSPMWTWGATRHTQAQHTRHGAYGLRQAWAATAFTCGRFSIKKSLASSAVIFPAPCVTRHVQAQRPAQLGHNDRSAAARALT
jgi:hypothetical protein